jgi:hypothetical protein
MKSLSLKTYQFVLFLILISFVLLASLSFLTNNIFIQTNPDSTPTATPKAEKAVHEPVSGDTIGLIYGAILIFLIILGGVLVQMLVNKPGSPKKPET